MRKSVEQLDIGKLQKTAVDRDERKDAFRGRVGGRGQEGYQRSNIGDQEAGIKE